MAKPGQGAKRGSLPSMGFEERLELEKLRAQNSKLCRESAARRVENTRLRADLDAAATAKAMLAIVIGMRVYSRAGTSRATLKTLADQALDLLER